MDTPYYVVGDLYPEDVVCTTIPPGMSVADALQTMLDGGSSQVPVQDDSLRGMLSLRSVLCRLKQCPELLTADLPVADIMEPSPPSIQVTDRLDDLLELLHTHEAIPVGPSHHLQAVATAYDVVVRYHRISYPFELVRECELILRSIVERCLVNHDLPRCLDDAVGLHYRRQEERKPPAFRRPHPEPRSPEELSMGDYEYVVTHDSNWGFFRNAFASPRKAGRNLKRINNLRNNLLHFRLSPRQLDAFREELEPFRDWLRDVELKSPQLVGGRA